MDIRKLAFRHLKQAQKRLKKRGGIECIATAYDSHGARLFDTMIDCDDRATKRIQQIEFQVTLMRYENVAAVVVSSEGWLGKKGIDAWPSEQPDREEVIAIIVSTPDNIFGVCQTFREDEAKQKISFGPIVQGRCQYNAFTDLIWPREASTRQTYPGLSRRPDKSLKEGGRASGV